MREEGFCRTRRGCGIRAAKLYPTALRSFSATVSVYLARLQRRDGRDENYRGGFGRGGEWGVKIYDFGAKAAAETNYSE